MKWKDSPFAYLVPVVAAVALLVLSLMAYAAFLTGAWISILACTPAILVTIALVGGMVSGMTLFGAEEEETPEEAARLDGVALFDHVASGLVELVHRAAIRLHVRGVGP